MKKHHCIIVLSDGETWETVGTQSFCVIDGDQYADLANGKISAKDLQPVVEFGLTDHTPFNYVA